jgi:hypothetical protein
MSRFHETLIMFRVLSENPIEIPSGPVSMTRLASSCIEGDNVGEVVMTSSREITRAHMGELLYAAKGESGFFGIEDLVEVTEELIESADQTGCPSGLVVVEASAVSKLCDLADVKTEKVFV